MTAVRGFARAGRHRNHAHQRRDTLKTKLTDSESRFESSTKAVDETTKTFENERKTLINHSLDRARSSARSPRPTTKVWEGRLARDFANEFPAFEKLAPR